MQKLTTFAIVSGAILVTSCGNTTTPAGATETATEAEICRQLGDKLPTRSRSDTEQTKAEIQELYAGFSLTCPNWAHLIP